jgi:hypothetical protein
MNLEYLANQRTNPLSTWQFETALEIPAPRNRVKSPWATLVDRTRLGANQVATIPAPNDLVVVLSDPKLRD